MSPPAENQGFRQENPWRDYDVKASTALPFAFSAVCLPPTSKLNVCSRHSPHKNVGEDFELLNDVNRWLVMTRWRGRL